MSIVFKRFFNCKERIIPISFHAERVAVEILKHPFEEHPVHFELVDPSKYHECVFYSDIAASAAKTNPNDFSNEYEHQMYNDSVNRLLKFKQTDDFVKRMSTFTWELFTLYQDLQRNITGNNFSSRKPELTAIYENDVKEAVTKYIQLVDNLREYPEWRQKVVKELGHYTHLIFNNLEESSKEELFRGYNKHEFFV